MRDVLCFECGNNASHEHHVIPVSRGGAKTVPLCTRCHGLAHDIEMKMLTSAAMQYKRSKFEYTGGPVRYGYDVAEDGVRLVENEAEQTIRARARDMHSAGMSLRAVASELTAMGLRSRKGTSFYAAQIRNMVKEGNQ